MDAPISVVVMAINGDPRAPAAVASLREQDVAIEIIVVNTGQVSLKGVLGANLNHVVLVEAEGTRLPGGTRNLGIDQSTGGIIAFLAADCIASPNWASRRLAAHAGGSRAVASALEPAPDPAGGVSRTGWAAYWLLHARRGPEIPPDEAARYGVSYDRALFKRHGIFREDMRIGEDTEFNARITLETPISWAPDVITLHHYPATLREGIADFFDRGRILYAWYRAHKSWPLRATLLRVAGNWRIARQFARYSAGEKRQMLDEAAPAMLLLTLSYASGVWAASMARLFGLRW